MDQKPNWAEELGQDRHGSWTTARVGGSSIRMRLCPPGSFRMGSTAEQIERKEGWIDEGPAHVVTLTEGFWIADTPVTLGLWNEVGGEPTRELQDDPDCPVGHALEPHCDYFVERLREHLPDFRLPTEAEWEYACRAGTTSLYWNGDNESSIGDVAWFLGNAEGSAHPVASKLPNPWGLYDCHGNVFERCLRVDETDSYRGEDRADPAGMDAPTVLRGGSWKSDPKQLRCACRFWLKRPWRGVMGLRLAAGI